MGLDISVISEIVPIDIPEDIELWSDEYYEWEEKQDFKRQIIILTNVLLHGDGRKHFVQILVADCISTYHVWRKVILDG